MEKSNQNNEFLQSAPWQKFQEAVGRKTFLLENEPFLASLIEHSLPIVGKYLYCPRGPILEVESEKLKEKNFLGEIINLAKKENAGWIRIEPENKKVLEFIKENISDNVVKAPHDMQPKEIFVLDISKPEQQLLSEMKSKTRYNIGVARKKQVQIIKCSKKEMECMPLEMEFLRLTREMAARQGISTHPENYYKKMLESLPADMLSLYAAKYDDQIIAANLVLFFGETATYLHGASSNDNRNVMAPFLLQWQAILDAKEKGFAGYDFGGVKTSSSDDSWAGITQFKLGFSPNTKPIEFPGSYDIVINPRKYAVYRGLQRAKAFAVKFRR